MKKTLLVLSAILALSLAFVGCKKSTGGDEPDSSDPGAKPAFVMTYNAGAQWAAPAFTVADDWESIEVVFADGTDFDKIQFAVISDKVEKEESWGTAYYSLYPQATATTKIEFAKWLNEEKGEDGSTLADHGATKIAKISIQNKTTGAVTVKVISAKITKTDGSVVDVKPVGDWASKVD